MDMEWAAGSSSETSWRLGMFLAVLGLMAVWELAAPRRRQEMPRLLRWSNNLALVALDTLLLRLVFPLTAVAFAGLVQQNGWGLLNWLALPGWLSALIAMLLLDLAIYGQHVMFHKVPLLWRLHRMHHADTEIDVTTGLRFHPIEILLSMLIKFAVIAALGASPLAVLLFEIILNAASLFNHSNIRLPEKLDAGLRLILVTPDMHRVHHSVERAETDSNYGFNVPWWDRMFGTYRPQPAAGHLGMSIGQRQFRSRRDAWLDRMLLQPFRSASRQHKPVDEPEVDPVGQQPRQL
jgi:sterol desaturase/sphingolipid hydroxylase (fatty acid hydroxylase superfamily)